MLESRGLDHARGEAEAAAGDGETVVALGGDGLVNALAGALRGAKSALAIVPAGRGNDFARAIGIPRDASAAARLAVDGRERLVDVGEVNGTPFVGIASVGLDSDVNRLAARARLVRGELVYFYAALRGLMAWRHASFDVVLDGRPRRLRGYSVAIANTGVYGGGMKLVPHAELDDGRLDVVMVAKLGKLRFLRTFVNVFEGGHVGHPAVSFDTARAVEVHADRAFVVYADGEPIASLPVTVRVQPGALRVIAPHRDAGQSG